MSASVPFTCKRHNMPESSSYSQDAVDGGTRSEQVISRWMTSTPDSVQEQPPHHIHAQGQCPSLAPDTFLTDCSYRGNKSGKLTYMPLIFFLSTAA